MSVELRRAARTLSDEMSSDEVEGCLMRWGIVLSILASDTLEGVVSLLESGNQRSANMLARTLAEYNVRLRYYYVQSIRPVHGLKKGDANPKFVLPQIRALQDWKTSQTKYATILNQYDPSIWTEDSREAIVAALSGGKKGDGIGFTDMCKFLAAHEVKDRGVIPAFQDGLAWSHKHALPAYAMQSCFLHGDQVVISDVIEFDDRGDPTGQLYLRPPYDAARPILFTALDHATEIMRSMAFVRPKGWIENEALLKRQVQELFLASS